jgi:ABC-2 type transport system ATP-binding protein
MSHPIIELEGLHKSFGHIVAAHHLTMSIPAGEIFGFLGANGAGKTTTIRMLCGLLKPTSGHATIDGGQVWHDRYSVRSKFGYVAQRFSLYPDLTVYENFRFFGGACRVPGAELDMRIDRLLTEMDLVAKRDEMASSLSGGMKQLLSLGCALVHEPKLLFLDEPTSGLDPVHRHQMWNQLYDLSHRGTTIFVTTHYMDEAERCTEVGFLDKGRLLAKDSPRRLKESFKSRLLEMQVEPLMTALVELRAAPGVLGVALRSGRIRIYADEPEKLVAEWERHWPFANFRWLEHHWVDADMEDVFTAYSQGYHAILKNTATS